MGVKEAVGETVGETEGVVLLDMSAPGESEDVGVGVLESEMLLEKEGVVEPDCVTVVLGVGLAESAGTG